MKVKQFLKLLANLKEERYLYAYTIIFYISGCSKSPTVRPRAQLGWLLVWLSMPQSADYGHRWTSTSPHLPSQGTWSLIILNVCPEKAEKEIKEQQRKTNKVLLREPEDVWLAAVLQLTKSVPETPGSSLLNWWQAQTEPALENCDTFDLWPVLTLKPTYSGHLSKQECGHKCMWCGLKWYTKTGGM